MAKLKRPQKLQQQVAELLEQNILGGRWPVGTKLPTEQALCDDLGVSRTILREAIATLKSQGLVESRQGSGVFVIGDSLTPILRIENEGLRRIEALRELMELRFSIELNIAYLAALRRTDRQMRAIWSAHNALAMALDAGGDHWDLDIRYHMAIADAANNLHFGQFLNFLLGQVADLAKKAREEPDAASNRQKSALTEHLALVKAIEAGDAENARSAAWLHQINAAKRMGIRGLLAWENLRMANLREPQPRPGIDGSIPVSAPRSPLPAESCDTHVSLIGDPERYPTIPQPSYTPGHSVDFAAYDVFQEAFGINRAVFIQASLYGSDNRLLLDTLEKLADDRYRGVAFVQPETPQQELHYMHRLGVRGARVNTLFRTHTRPALLPDLAAAIRPLGWHIDLQADVSEFRDFHGQISELDVPVVVDHMGHIPSDIGVQARGFQDMIRLLQEGRIWVRLSGFCRITVRETLPFTDIKPYMDALIAARPDRLIWGSNWPHLTIDFTPPSDADLFAEFSDWVGDDALFRQILVDNPTALYWGSPDV